MKERVIAKRYGRALFELALGSGADKDLAADIQKLGDASASIPTLIRGLSDERIDLKKRLAAAGLISRALGLGKTSTSFLSLLIEKGRVSIVNLIAKDFVARMERFARLAVASAKVSSAKLKDEVKEKIEGIISQTLNLESKCAVDVDESLIGGFAVWLGDKRYDASIRGKLERMREELL